MPGPYVDSECFVCGAAVRTLERYPRIACVDCRHRAVNAAGERLRFYNTGPGGGFEARRVDDDTVDEDVTRDHVVSIDGQECYVDEARFGGIVVQPLDARPDRSDR